MNRNKWPFWYSGYNFWRAPIKATEHWWGNVCGFFRRGRLGWSYGDAWDIDKYLGQVIPAMLRHMANYGMSCPMEYVEKYPNDDEVAHQAWHNDLIHIADLIEFANSDEDEHNKYAKEYWNTEFNKLVSVEKEQLRDAYYQEEKIIYDKQQKAIQEAMAWIGEHWFALWD